MSSDKSDIAKESGGAGTTTSASKGFPRAPLEYGSSLLGAGSPSFESRLSFKRYEKNFSPPLSRNSANDFPVCRAREIQQQEGVPANYWSNPIGSSNSSPSKTPAEPTIPEGTSLPFNDLIYTYLCVLV